MESPRQRGHSNESSLAVFKGGWFLTVVQRRWGWRRGENECIFFKLLGLIGHHKEIQELTFRVLAFRQSVSDGGLTY